MNRRKFLEALAGIPLLGLLVKLPEAKEEFHVTMPSDPGYVEVPRYEAAYVELQSGAEVQPPYELGVGNKVGKTIFVDEVAGDDALSPATAVSSPERVCALASAPRGDVIIQM